MAGNQTFDTPQDALQHYGVKGMKWGVRRDRPSGSSSSSSSTSSKSTGAPPLSETERRFNAKKAALGAGILLGVAGAGYLTYQMQQNGGLKSFNSSTTNKGQQAAEKILKEPTDTILGSRGKHLGFRFVSEGGTDGYAEWRRAGFTGHSPLPFTRYGDNKEKIALTLSDPEGRRDEATRLISHDLIIPASMSKGINNERDVVEKIWPHVKPTYDAFWEKSLISKYDKPASPPSPDYGSAVGRKEHVGRRVTDGNYGFKLQAKKE